MKRFLIFVVLIPSMLLTGCYYFGPCVDGTGPLIIETRDVSGFTAISNTGSFEVIVTESDEFSVEVEAEENLLPIIETYLSGYTLIIQTREGSCFRSGTPVVYITLPELEALMLTGSGTVWADVADTQEFECSNSGSGDISVDSVFASKLNVNNSGSGTIDVKASSADEISLVQSGSGTIDGGTVYQPVDVSILHSSSGKVRASVVEGINVEAIMSGSGRIDLYGDAHAASYTLNSSGRIDALDLMVDNAEAKITGSGNILLYANYFLNATITGSGDVIYRGNPAVSFQITGSGSVKPY